MVAVKVNGVMKPKKESHIQIARPAPPAVKVVCVDSQNNGSGLYRLSVHGLCHRR